MQGICSKAVTNAPQNSKKYQQYEFTSDFGINFYESFYRTHDPQIGRFWQLDPKPNQFVSLYCSMGNNPISLNDLLGDTIYYYNSMGAPIGTINHGKGLTAVETTKEASGFVALMLWILSSNNNLSENLINSIDAFLQGMGVSYDISAMIQYYEAKASNNSIESIDGIPITSGKNYKFNGKSINPKKLNAEASIKMIKKNQKITIGKIESEYKDLLRSYDPDGVETGQTNTFLHTHTNNPTGRISFDINYSTYYYDIKPEKGVSRKDQNTALDGKRFAQGIRYAAVDKNFVYLFNGYDNQTIKIPK